MAAASDVGSKLLAWIMAGTGSLLLYSAFRNRSPLDVLRDIDGPPLTTSSSGDVGPQGFAGGSTGNFSSSVPRIRALANREEKPDLVSIRGGGQLDRDAAASLERIFTKLGYVVPNVGAYRSYATQATLNAGNPNRFASASGSMHVAGLAIDVHSSYVNRAEVISAFQAEGWQRYDPQGEAHHWSYLVRG